MATLGSLRHFHARVSIPRIEFSHALDIKGASEKVLTKLLHIIVVRSLSLIGKKKLKKDFLVPYTR